MVTGVAGQEDLFTQFEDGRDTPCYFVAGAEAFPLLS